MWPMVIMVVWFGLALLVMTTSVSLKAWSGKV